VQVKLIALLAPQQPGCDRISRPVRRLEVAAAAFSEVFSKSLYVMKALATA
jgi:hypothetical protein